MQYNKSNPVSGKWFKAADFEEGTLVKLISETKPTESQFKDERTGQNKIQDVAKIVVKGNSEAMNIALNRATIDGLVDAFGEDSKSWMNQVLTMEKEKVIVGGKRVNVPYLIPEGYEKVEDETGFMHIVRKGKRAEVAPEEINLDEEPGTEPPF